MSISQLEFGPLVFPHLVACIVAKGRWFPMLPIDSKKKKKDFLRVSALIVFRADQRLDFLSAVSDILKIPNAQEISICQRRWERKRTWTSTLKMPRSTISLGKNTEPIKRHVHCLKTGSWRRLPKQINFPLFGQDISRCNIWQVTKAMVSSKGLSFGSRGNWKERTRKKLTRKKHLSRVEIARESLCYSLYLLNPARFSF